MFIYTCYIHVTGFRATKDLLLRLLRAMLTDSPPVASHGSIHVYHFGLCCLTGVADTFHDTEITPGHLDSVSVNGVKL